MELMKVFIIRKRKWGVFMYNIILLVINKNDILWYIENL